MSDRPRKEFDQQYQGRFATEDSLSHLPRNVSTYAGQTM
jgi:hypothetical protein